MNPMLLMFAAQSGQGILSGLQQRKDLIKQNKAIARQNMAQMAETQTAIKGVELQQALARAEAAGNMATARKVALAAGGEQAVAAAAAGVRGASVDAVQLDIQRELDEALSMERQNAIQTEFNLNQQISQMARQTTLNLQPLAKVPSIGSTITRGLVGGAVNTGSAYASSRFQYGVSQQAGVK